MKTINEKYYDFVVTDFDGTIFNSRKEVSHQTVQTIRSFITRGGTFCVCTGRMTGAIIPLLKKFNLETGYLISYNGAEICNITTGEKVYKNHIDNNTAVKLLQYAEKNKIDLMVYPNDVITVQSLTPLNQIYLRLNNTKGAILGKKVSEYFIENNFTTGKALFLTGGDDALATRLINEVSELLGEDFNITHSNSHHVDIMKKGVSKGDTIKIFAKLAGKSIDKLICFGDEMNDESMLKVASVSAVPVSGSPLLKAKCDLIIAACDDDGVRKAIEKYCI